MHKVISNKFNDEHLMCSCMLVTMAAQIRDTCKDRTPPTFSIKAKPPQLMQDHQ